MNTDDLISNLAREARPIGRHAALRRLAIGAAAGVVGSVALLAAWFGLRADLTAALVSPPFLIKMGYGLTLAALAFAASLQLAQPERRRVQGLSMLGLPVAALVVLAAVEFTQTPFAAWRAGWLGASADMCPWRVAALAAPIYLGIIWAYRRFAPTRRLFAGAIAGLASGGAAAAVYALYCPEPSTSFILTWYTLGILIAAGVGALGGRALLRW